jgi:two-component system phosphate regulon sensor histidine kinase PhoR
LVARLAAGAVPRPSWREAGYIALPGLLALAALWLAGHVPLMLALLAASAAAGLAVALAAWRARDLARLARWLESVGGEGDAPPPEIGPPLDAMVRPLVEVGRALRRQRAELEGQRRLLEAILDRLPDPVLLIGRERMIRLANPAAKRSFGGSLVGLPLGRAVRDPTVTAAVTAAIDTGSDSTVTFSPAGDRLKQFAAHVEPVPLEDGGTGVLMTFREQSEQVLIERLRSDFVANASHEIRTPLAAIHGLIETLQGPARDDAAAREAFLDTMAQETARMTRLVDDLLSLSRIELAAHQPPTERCDVDRVLASVIDRMRPLAAKRRVRLDYAAGEPLPPILADSDQLHQLFVNLIDNAIKYGGGRPVRVEVEARAAAPADAGGVSGRPCVVVAVVDSGDGIAPEHIPRLTERFYRVDKARSRGQGGTGLGLAIVKHIVRRHGGHLAIASQLGKGSRFTVYLPAAEAP